MFIPTIYLLLSAEIIFILLIFSIGLLIYLYKFSNKKDSKNAADEISDDELEEAFDLSTSYSEYLQLEVERNQNKATQTESNILSDQAIENEEAEDVEDNEDELDNLDAELENELTEISPEDKENQQELLRIRELFLNAEKASANYQNNEINFWDSIFKNMSNIVDELTTVIHKKNTSVHMDVESNTKPEIQEKVFYIETQGKKVDGEVNKLKDIIHDQENALNALKKSVKSVEVGEINQELLDEIQAQVTALEAQLGDSKMCMEVLEMENDRLQEEVNQLDSQYTHDIQEAAASAESSVEDIEPPTIDLSELQDMVHKQKGQIEELNSTIDELQVSAEVADKMKQTIGDFARSGQEMMGCISILEDENKHFKFLLAEKGASEDEISNEGSEALAHLDVEIEETNSADVEELKTQINTMEEEIIQKDTAYAQLQEEFESIEKEYLSMYEAMHGDNS